jgi:hypothetical protein
MKTIKKNCRLIRREYNQIHELSKVELLMVKGGIGLFTLSFCISMSHLFLNQY